MVHGRGIHRICSELLKRRPVLQQRRWCKATELSARRPVLPSVCLEVPRRCTGSPRASRPGSRSLPAQCRPCLPEHRSLPLHWRWQDRQYASRAQPCCSGEYARVSLNHPASRNSPSPAPRRNCYVRVSLAGSTAAPAGARCWRSRQENGKNTSQLPALGMASRFIPFPGAGSSFNPRKPGRSNPHASCAGTASIPTPNNPCGSA